MDLLQALEDSDANGAELLARLIDGAESRWSQMTWPEAVRVLADLFIAIDLLRRRAARRGA